MWKNFYPLNPQCFILWKVPKCSCLQNLETTHLLSSQRCSSIKIICPEFSTHILMQFVENHSSICMKSRKWISGHFILLRNLHLENFSLYSNALESDVGVLVRKMAAHLSLGEQSPSWAVNCVKGERLILVSVHRRKQISSPAWWLLLRIKFLAHFNSFLQTQVKCYPPWEPFIIPIQR